MYKITLSDGTILHANLNGNTWESPTEVTEDIFEGRLGHVTVEDEEGHIEDLGAVNLVYMGEHDGEWWFGLNPLTEIEKAIRQLTPYSLTKTAYIDDTSLTFENVPAGNMSVYVGGVNHSFFERNGDRVVVRFEALTESKEVTISII